MRLGLFSLLVVILSACSSAPVYTPEVVRRMQTRIFEKVSYAEAYRTSLQALKDVGYLVRSEDPSTGIIVYEPSEKGKPLSKQDEFDSYRFTLSLQKLPKPKVGVKTRLSLQKIRHSRLGGVRGDEIVDPTYYKVMGDLLQMALATAQKPEDSETTQSN